MYNNLYVKYNYKNIIPFSLKKKRLRVHANIIANKVSQSFFIGDNVKFWYHFYGINGLKRDNTILVKKFLNKKLSVFFISKLNMIESKWGFPRIYESFYQKYSNLKNKKKNLFKLNTILNKEYSDYSFSISEIHNNFFSGNKSFLNILFLKYFFKNNLFIQLNLKYDDLNNFNLFKFSKLHKNSILFIKNIRKRRILKKDPDSRENKKIYFRKKYKMLINSQGSLNYIKNNNDLKKNLYNLYFGLKSNYIKNTKFKNNLNLRWSWNFFNDSSIDHKQDLNRYISYLDDKIKKNTDRHYFFKNKNNKTLNKPDNNTFDKKLYFKNKKFTDIKDILESENVLKKLQIIIKSEIFVKFCAIKKMLIITQILKLFKELKNFNSKYSMCLWFYKSFINFKALKLIKKKVKKIFKKKFNKKKKSKFVGLYLTKKNKKILKKKKLILFILSKKNNINLKKILNSKNKKTKYFLRNGLLKKKKIYIQTLFWIKRLCKKINKKRINQNNYYLYHIIKFNNILRKLYNTKIFSNNLLKINNTNFLNKIQMHYNLLDSGLYNYNTSRLRRLNKLKQKKLKNLGIKRLKAILKSKIKKDKELHDRTYWNKFNMYSFLNEKKTSLEGEYRFLSKVKDSSYGLSLRKIWNTLGLKKSKIKSSVFSINLKKKKNKQVINHKINIKQLKRLSKGYNNNKYLNRLKKIRINPSLIKGISLKDSALETVNIKNSMFLQNSFNLHFYKAVSKSFYFFRQKLKREMLSMRQLKIKKMQNNIKIKNNFISNPVSRVFVKKNKIKNIKTNKNKKIVNRSYITFISKNINYTKKEYSTYSFFKSIQDKNLLVTRSFNDVLNIVKSDNYKISFVYEKRINKFWQNSLNRNKKLTVNFNKRLWFKENLRLHCLFKEYLFSIYEDEAFNVYLKFLGHYFFSPLKYDFFLTNNMKIKAYLWTAPKIVRLEESPIIELRTISERINDLIKLKVKFRLWKSLKVGYKRIPLLFYENLKKVKISII